MVGQEGSERSEAKHADNHLEAEEADSGLNIVEVIGRYVQLKRVGKVFQGRCPFHVSDGKGRQQTLVVWPETQTFNCFKPGCKANVKSRRLGRRQGILDFLELIGEIPAGLPPESAQEAPRVGSSQEQANVPETLALPRMEPKPMFSRVSYSMLESYQLCPLRFKREYVERKSTEKTTRNRRLGLSIHATLNKFYSLPVQDRTLSRLHQLLGENWQTSPYGIQEDTYWHKRAYEMLEAVYYSEGALANPIALERSFTFHAGDFVVFGRVDRIDRISTDQYEVIDYKVLRGDPGDEREAIDSLQSVCLYFGAYSLLGAFPTRITYLHMDTGVRVSFTPAESRMEDGLSKIKNLVKEMREATDFPATRNRFCSACQLLGHCPATR